MDFREKLKSDRLIDDPRRTSSSRSHANGPARWSSGTARAPTPTDPPDCGFPLWEGAWPTHPLTMCVRPAGLRSSRSPGANFLNGRARANKTRTETETETKTETETETRSLLHKQTNAFCQAQASRARSWRNRATTLIDWPQLRAAADELTRSRQETALQEDSDVDQSRAHSKPEAPAKVGPSSKQSDGPRKLNDENTEQTNELGPR